MKVSAGSQPTHLGQCPIRKAKERWDGDEVLHARQKVEFLRELRIRANPQMVAEFDEKFDQSWIYHDNALEGVVLSYHELKAAIDKKIISDVTLIPMYEEIKNHKARSRWCGRWRARGRSKRHDKKAAAR